MLRRSPATAASEVLPTGFADTKLLPFLIQYEKTWVNPDRADAGEREVELAHEGFDLDPMLRRRGEQQLVVVAAGQRSVSGAGQIACGSRER
jgi:hypothetical protein